MDHEKEKEATFFFCPSVMYKILISNLELRHYQDRGWYFKSFLLLQYLCIVHL